MAREMLSPHFAKDECVCRCSCGLCNATPRLLMMAEKIRDLLRQPMIVTSVCRCREHNAKVCGSPQSKHLLGRAMDFYCKRLSPQAVYDAIVRAWENGELSELGGVGIYDWGIHIDTEKAPDGHLRRWDKRKAR